MRDPREISKGSDSSIGTEMMTVVENEETPARSNKGIEEEEEEEEKVVALDSCEKGTAVVDDDKSDLEKTNDEESLTSSLEEEETTEDDDIPIRQVVGAVESSRDDDDGLVVINIPSELSSPSADTSDSAPDPEGTSPPDASSSSSNNNNSSKKNNRLSKRKKRIILLILTIIVLGLVVAIPIGVKKSKENALEREREERSKKRRQETEEARAQAIALIPGITNQTLDNMWDDWGPERKALEKIVLLDPLWDTYEDWRKQQRFAMACLFHEFYRYYRREYQEITVSPHLHECEWMDDTNRVVATCNSKQQIKIVDWIGKTWVDGRWTKRALPVEMSFLSHLHTLDCSEGIFLVGGPTDDFIRETWDDDEAYQKGLEKYTHPGLELVFPSATTDDDEDDFSWLKTPGNNWTLPSLKELKIDNCVGLEGMVIPTSVGLLTSLTKLDLSLNELSSTVPSQLGLLTRLTSLNLHSNNFVGTLPEELSNLSSLKAFNVKENYLNVSLPAGFCYEERIPRWSQLVTDWCWVPDHCCG